MAKKIVGLLFENPPHLVFYCVSNLLPSASHESAKILEDNRVLFQVACTRFEREFGRTLLLLDCRHHTRELILKVVFEKCCSIPRTVPDPDFFKFRSLRASNDKKSYTTMLDEESPV